MNITEVVAALIWQGDEDAWKFYEKLGYHKVGGFFPPEQEAEEWMYIKELGK